MLQINVASTMAVVEILSVSLHSYMSILDTMALSVLLIAGSYLSGHENTLILLSRRISMLLLVHLLKPALSSRVPRGLGFFTHMQSLMTNAGIICCLAFVPKWWRETQEGRVVSTAVIYLYTNLLDFVAEYKEMRLGVFMSASIGLWGVSTIQKNGKNFSQLYSLFLEVVAIILSNLILIFLTPTHIPETDGQIIFVGLMITMTYAMSFVFDIAEGTENYLIYAVAAQVEAFVRDDWWFWAIGLAAIFLCLKKWIGPNVWITSCSLLILCDVIVSAALRYVRHLAAHDTVVTLKAAALVVQFILHEAARRFHGDTTEL